MELMVKGYAIQATAEFLSSDPDLRGRLPDDFVKEAVRATSAMKATEWYGRSEAIDLYAAIARAYSSDAEAYAAFVRCGRATAGAAIKGYLKLLLKVLTPRMFASKFPDFWSRDHQSGHAEVGVIEDKRLVLRLRDVGGFDHIGPVSAGFIDFAMEAIGMKGVEVTCTPWSLATPGPNDVEIEVRWTR